MSAIRYNIARDAVITDQLIESGSTSILSIGSGSLESGYSGIFLKTSGQFIETSSLTRTVRISNTNQTVTARFFIETGSVLPVPFITGSPTFDLFYVGYYLSGSELSGLNSGSQEWNNVTPDAEYKAKNTAVGLKMYDLMTEYISGSLFDGSNSGSLPDYTENGGYWDSPWIGRSTPIGIIAFDDFNLYESSSNINGSGSNPDLRYLAFNDYLWSGRSTPIGIIAFDDFSLYASGSNINGSGSNPDQRYLEFNDYLWIGR